MGMSFQVDLSAISNDWDESIESIVQDELRKILRDHVKDELKNRTKEIERSIARSVDRWLADPVHSEALTRMATELYKKAEPKHAIFK